MARLTWRGAEVGGRVNEAAKIGIDRTMADCVAYAQQDGPLGAPHDTGWLKNNIKPVWAVRQGSRMVGRWGNVDAPDYALIQQIRNGYLTRAADAMYGSLPERIRAAM